MLTQIATGLGLVCTTAIIHAAFMVAGVRGVHHCGTGRSRGQHEIVKATTVSLFTTWMFLGVIVEVSLWAAFYLYHPEVGTLPDTETAFYFSMVTFTTVGYGDIVLVDPWRVLASIEAANGVIIFGWTTALIFYVIQTVYARK